MLCDRLELGALGVEGGETTAVGIDRLAEGIDSGLVGAELREIRSRLVVLERQFSELALCTRFLIKEASTGSRDTEGFGRLAAVRQ